MRSVCSESSGPLLPEVVLEVRLPQKGKCCKEQTEKWQSYPLGTRAPTHPTEKDNEEARDAVLVKSEGQDCPWLYVIFKVSMDHMRPYIKTTIK